MSFTAVQARALTRRSGVLKPIALASASLQSHCRNYANKAVVYKGPGEVAVENIDYPKLELKEQNRKCVG